MIEIKTCGIIDPIVTRFENKPKDFFFWLQHDILEILTYLVPKYGYTRILSAPEPGFNVNVFRAVHKYQTTTRPDLQNIACLMEPPRPGTHVYTPENAIVTNTGTRQENQEKLIDLCDEILILASTRDIKDGTPPVKRTILYAQKKNASVRSIPYEIEHDAIRLHF